MLWLAEWFDRMNKAFHNLPSARTVGLIFVALLALFVIVRFVIAARAGDETGVRAVRRRSGTSTTDPWQIAESLLAQGRFEDAAHALYRGVIVTLGREERLRLHASKTSGDYARELRRRGSASYAPFRTFTRRFDVAVYGHGGCDAAALDELRALSEPFRPRARVA